jgi:hypothetical protein
MTEPADILQWSTESSVPFRKYGAHQREFALFSSRFYPFQSWDTYDTKDFKDIPILIQCMNQILQNSLIEGNLLNSCVIERVQANSRIPESPVFPSDLNSYIQDDSPMAILCRGPQNVIDVIPKTYSEGMQLGRVDAGRLSPGHGSAIFLSANTLKRYQVQSKVGFNMLTNSVKPSSHC